MAAKPSKFKDLFDATQDPAPEDTAAPVAPDAEPLPKEQAPPPRPTGRRPNGKKSDPRYKQVTAYVRKDLHRAVTDALYDDARGQDTKRKEFSELVDELLERWWQERNGQSTKAG